MARVRRSGESKARREEAAGRGDSVFSNRVRETRVAEGLSASALAQKAGLTRQAMYAIEGDRYLPNVGTALRLARALDRRVEDLFALRTADEVIEGELLGGPGPRPSAPTRAKVWKVGDRTFVLPVTKLGPALSYSVAADGLILREPRARRRAAVKVRLLSPRDRVVGQLVIAGCDPAIHLVAERLRQHREPVSVIGWPMGSMAALQVLKRGQVHVAGLHLLDPRSGEANAPFVRRHLGDRDVTLVTFASWEAGLLVPKGNPKGIRGVADLGRPDVRIVNREEGAGARLLLDQRLAGEGLSRGRIRGYRDLAASHLDVGRRIVEGAADAGVGVLSVAGLLGLDFLPLQTERYDLVIPSELMGGVHPALARLLEALATREVRAEIEALGGYDASRAGQRVEPAAAGVRTPGRRVRALLKKSKVK
jgi:putative molybdopterin biosynthesis protein